MSTLRTLTAAGAVTAAAVLLAGSAMAAEPLSWSFAFTSVNRCTVGVSCTAPETLDRTVNYDLNNNAFASSSPVDYAAITPNDYGSAFASAAPGTGGAVPLPDLHAYTSGTVVPGTPTTFSWNFAQTQGVQGFRWDGEAPLELPFDAFVGSLEYSYSGVSTGLISAALALVTDAVRKDDVGFAWYEYSRTPGFFGQFAASCATEGAIALANPAHTTLTGSGSGNLTIAPTSCVGGDTFTLDPGEEFFVWARLSAFRAATGVTDANNSFTVHVSPDLDPTLMAALTENLTAIPGSGGIGGVVPEPGTWALLITGFAGVGAALRTRRRLQLETGARPGSA